MFEVFFRLRFAFSVFQAARRLEMPARLQLKTRAMRGMPCLNSAAFSYAESFLA
ncbi:MAG: hypothetical protein WB445_10230 [Acinetobacter sp.]